MVKAAESRLGPIVSISVPKDSEIRRARQHVFVTTLRPTTLTADGVLEIPAPATMRSSDYTGVGPTYQELVATLRSDTSPVKPSQNHDAPIQFRIDALQKAPTPPRSYTQKVYRNQWERQTDDSIVRALQAFDGGFAGGFDGVADKFAHLVETQPAKADEVAERKKAEEAALLQIREQKELNEQEEEEENVDRIEAVAQITAESTPAPKLRKNPMSRAEKLRKRAIDEALRAAALAQPKQEASRTAAASDTKENAPEAEVAEAKTVEAESKETTEATEQSKQGILSKWFGGKA